LTEYIDLGPDGPAGVEARVKSIPHPVRRGGHRLTLIWFRGSNHRRDWFHHILPGARRREIQAAREVFNRLNAGANELFIVGGHSLGGALASILSTMLEAEGERVLCYSYGGKRPPRGYMTGASLCPYRRRGDVVPFLAFWRPAWPAVVKIGEWRAPWNAHPRGGYRRYIEEAGLDFD